MRRFQLACVVVLLGLSACSVKEVTFLPGPDAVEGADAAIDGAPGLVAIVPSAAAVTVTEGTSKTFTITLSAPPTAATLVTLASTDDGKLGVSPTALLFQPSSWATPKTITLSGKSDPDIADEHVGVMLGADGLPSVTVDVTVDDDDGLAFQVTPSTLDVSEGATGPVAVHLTAQPLADVEVTVTSSDPTTAMVAPSVLKFTAADWNLDQAVTVAGQEDVDTTNDPATITFSAAGITDATAAITVTDNDVLGIALSTSSLNVNEGASAAFAVSLTQQPSADVTVALLSSDPGAVTAAVATLTFTSTDWDMPQSVMISAPQDLDTANESPTITLSAPTLANRTVAVTVTDDDVQQVLATPSPASVIEGGSGTFGAHLAFKPSADVIVTVGSLNPVILTANPTTLMFTASNYASDQVVTMVAAQDADAVNGATSVRIESVAAGLTTDVPVTIVDDDHLGIEVSAATVALGEGGAATFQVRLTAQPQGPVTVALASSDAAAATVTASLAFDGLNWATFQTATVTGVQDNDLAGETVAIELTAAGLAPATVTATVADDDVQQVLVASATAAVTEGQNTAVTATLRYQPSSTVSVAVVSDAPAVAAASPATLTFSPTDYATPHAVTISGVPDADAVNGAATVALTLAGATPASIAVTVTDDDVLAIEASVPSLSIGEAGSGVIGFRLTAAPTAPTTVTVTSSDPGAATASASLMFTSANWNVYQNVTVAGVNDADAMNESVTVTATAGALTKAVPVAVADDEVLGIATSASAVTLGEAGAATFTVQLTAAPAAATTVTLTSADAGAATVSPASFVFDSASWNTPRTVTVTGVADADLASESVQIKAAAPGLADRFVTATVTDDDTQVVLVTPTTATLKEPSEQAPISVSLGFIPSGAVTVTVGSTNTSAVTASTGSLTFLPGNYNVAQTVTLTAVHDVNTVADSATLNFTSPGAMPGAVAVTVTDVDVLGLETSAPAIALTEGAGSPSGSFGVRLTAQPSSPVTVAIASPDPAAVTASPATLTFTSATWNVYQPVTVAAVQDLDATNEAVVVTATSGALTAPVTVTVVDDEVQGIITDVGTVGVAEGGSGTIKVKLAAQPRLNLDGSPTSIVVNLAAAPSTVATAAPATLTFTSSTYDTFQTVTIAGLEDANLLTDTATISLTSTAAPTRTVTATVADNDTQQIVVSPTSKTLREDGTFTATVALAFDPTNPVTINVASTNTGAATVSPASVVLDSSNYSVGVPVTVSGVIDADLNWAGTNVIFSTGAISTTLPVTVVEPGLISMTVAAGSSTAQCEGDATTYDVKLLAAPPTAVTVTVGGTCGSRGLLVPATLSFTPTNATTAQQVTFESNSVAGVNTTYTCTVTVTSTNMTLRSSTVSVKDFNAATCNP
jgi:hypothetical protein